MAIKPRPCKRCKAEISAERLEAVPGTVLCVKCSQEVGGEWEYSFKEVNTGKAGSLKKNYGGISIEKRRKSSERLE
ncbi:MAG TPA: TraR/DksA C4-type zinc finger protein [Pirellulales bacterium]|nr:TraR/DksA C4-type zinc finger protein [Pirellulales bacterium]